MGNEGQGVCDEILELCQHRLYIPIQTVESLNVGIASAITMYHFQKQNSNDDCGKRGNVNKFGYVYLTKEYILMSEMNMEFLVKFIFIERINIKK